jgi:hypothetical protein
MFSRVEHTVDNTTAWNSELPADLGEKFSTEIARFQYEPSHPDNKIGGVSTKLRRFLSDQELIVETSRWKKKICLIGHKAYLHGVSHTKRCL